MSGTLTVTRKIAVGKTEPLPHTGAFVYCRTASQQEFSIQADNGAPISFFPGATWRPAGEFKTLKIINQSTTDELVVSVVVGPKDFELSQFRIAAANRIVTAVDVSVATLASASVLAASLDRQRVIIQNPFGNVREFRVGDSAVAGDRGVELSPGDRVELRTTAEIFAFNPDTAAMVLSVTEFLE